MAFRRPVTPMRVACHVLYWTLSYLITLSQFKRALADHPGSDLLYFVNTHHFLTTVVSFGLLGYVVVPYVLYRERTTWQRIALIVGVCGLYYALLCVNTYALLDYVQRHFQPLPPYLARRITLFSGATWVKYVSDPSIVFFIYGQFISYLTTPLLIKAVRDGYARSKAQQQAEEEQRRLAYDNLALEKENITKDLHFLRQQINPHFLLNAFNNIYAMIHRKDGRAAETLANLSTLMRYTLYRTSQDFVPLPDELDFISGYIDMERIRHTQPDAVVCELPDPAEDLSGWRVPPLLLVTFIENAFKHGLNAVYEGGWVRINLVVQTDDGRLTLTVVNNKPDATPSMTTDGGIGLRNVRQRLSLLFPECDYLLALTEQADQFTVKLSIPLQFDGDTKQHDEHTYTMSAH